MSNDTERKWREGLSQGFLWTDVLGDDGNVVAKVLTHKMTRPYASEPDSEGMTNLALVTAAPETAAERDRLRAVNAKLLRALGEAAVHLDFLADCIEDSCTGATLDIKLGRGHAEAARTAVQEATSKGMVNLALVKAAPRLFDALEAIAATEPDQATDHRQLTALFIAIARTAIEEAQL